MTSSSKCKLRLDFCSYKAAQFAVEHWHYSKAMPAGKLVHIGVWEDDRFIGCAMFGWSSNCNIGKPYDLQQIEVCELVRVALRKHQSPVSRILAIAIKMLKKQSPGLQLIVSYADSAQSHHGGIYQATNWVYVGGSGSTSVKLHGVITHGRSVSSRYGTHSIDWLRKNVDPKAENHTNQPKHKYLYPLTPEMKAKIELLRQPYPKPASANRTTPPDQGGAEGASPIQTL